MIMLTENSVEANQKTTLSTLLISLLNVIFNLRTACSLEGNMLHKKQARLQPAPSNSSYVDVLHLAYLFDNWQKVLGAEPAVPFNQDQVFAPTDMTDCSVPLAHVNHSVSNLNHIFCSFPSLCLNYTIRWRILHERK